MDITTKIKEIWNTIRAFLNRPIIQVIIYLFDIAVLLFLIASNANVYWIVIWAILVLIETIRMLHKTGLIDLPVE